jgi:hypothetical protein
VGVEHIRCSATSRGPAAAPASGLGFQVVRLFREVVRHRFKANIQPGDPQQRRRGRADA